MEIDRTRFLFLAAAISSGAAGCAPERPAEAPQPATASTSTPNASAPSAPTPDELCAELEKTYGGMTCSSEGMGGPPLDLPKTCRRYAKSFRPEVAKRAIECLERLDSWVVCGQDRCSVFGCAVYALEQAPLDPSTEPTCAQAEQSCSGIASACNRYLAGMNDAARANVSRCLADQCNGVFACLGFANYDSMCTDEG